MKGQYLAQTLVRRNEAKAGRRKKRGLNQQPFEQEEWNGGMESADKGRRETKSPPAIPSSARERQGDRQKENLTGARGMGTDSKTDSKGRESHFPYPRAQPGLCVTFVLLLELNAASKARSSPGASGRCQRVRH